MIKHYNIALLPDEALATRAVEVSQSLEPLGGIFVLKPGTFTPHISLYMLGLNGEALDQIAHQLGDVASRLQPMTLTPHRYYQSRGYIDVEYEKTNELQAAQAAVLEAFAQLRTSPHHDFTDPDSMIQTNVNTYGYKSVGELFRPHITFTRFDTEVEQDISQLPDSSEFAGQVEQLGLFQLGPNGTCIKEIESAQLGV